MTDFTLPELGEGVTTGDVLRVLVKPGDTVTKDQAVVELETDKATIEVPSSVAGVVKDVKVKVGDKVTVGQAILSVDEGGARAPAESAGAAGSSKSDAKAEEEQPAEKPVEAKASGKPGARARAQENAKAEVKEAEEEAEAEENEEPEEREAPAPRARRGEVVDISRGARAAAEPQAAPKMPPAPAGPSVRRLARELGVDINDVPVSGPGGRISLDDVKARAKELVAGATNAGAAAEPLPDFNRWGEIERQPMRAVRRKTAQHVTAAWSSIPHVTQFDVADITGLEELRHRFSKHAEEAGGNLTVTSIAVKVVAAALKVFPQFNASIDMASQEIILKKYVNIGVAVDTDRGLLVPVIRDADTKNIEQLSVELVTARRQGAHAQAHTRRDAGRLLHDHESGRHRWHGVHADRQLPRSRHPRHLTRNHAASVQAPSVDDRRPRRWRVRAPADVAALAGLRSSSDRRRRRHPLPALGRRGPQAAVPSRFARVKPTLATKTRRHEENLFFLFFFAPSCFRGCISFS